jgi:hypothetical protein
MSPAHFPSGALVCTTEGTEHPRRARKPSFASRRLAQASLDVRRTACGGTVHGPGEAWWPPCSEGDIDHSLRGWVSCIIPRREIIKMEGLLGTMSYRERKSPRVRCSPRAGAHVPLDKLGALRYIYVIVLISPVKGVTERFKGECLKTIGRKRGDRTQGRT